MLPNELFVAGSDDGGYEIQKSLRFRSSSLVHLTRTPAVAGDRTKWTWAGWVKRGALGSNQFLFSNANGAAANGHANIYFTTNDTLLVGATDNNTVNTTTFQTIAKFRDPSAWYFVLVVWDTTNVVASERVKIYVNGIRQSIDPTGNIVPTLNYQGPINRATNTVIGNVAYSAGVAYFDGYMAEVNFIDGQALTPSYFGEWNQETGQWKPIKYAGTYGANGFYLNFRDNSGITALGYDNSGNSNHWTPNNFSLTAGTNYDSMDDTPTNNFAVLNQIDRNTNGTINAGNLGISAGSQWLRTKSTIGVKSGKWYWETQHTVYNQSYQGICDDTFQMGTNNALGTTSGWSATYNNNGDVWINNAYTPSWGSTFTLGDIIGWALDMDNGTLQAYKNGVLQGTVVTGLNAKGTIYPAFSLANSAILNVNFGQRPFAYTPPTGFSALCSKNLPIPSIKRGETGFDIATYTGNGGNIQIGEYQFPRPSYLIDKSLRFKGVNQNLSRTPASTGNATLFTWSGWLKKTVNGVIQTFFAAGVDGSHNNAFGFDVSDRLVFAENPGTGVVNYRVSNNAFKDSANFHHIVLIADTGNANDQDRLRLFVDGLEITSWSTNASITQGKVLYINRNTAIHSLGSNSGGGFIQYFQGYLAEVNFIDGQALDPTNFGEFDINGYWIPKAYTGTYGQNGFYLDFEDTTAVANLGYDKSGRGNNWTTNNFSLTAGVTYDSMDDSPTNNYAVFDVLTKQVGTVSNGGLTTTTTIAEQGVIFGTLGVSSGKWYFEITTGGSSAMPQIGAWNKASVDAHYNSYDGSFYGNNTLLGTAGTAVSGDVIGCAINFDTNRISFSRNGVWFTNIDIDLRGVTLFPYINDVSTVTSIIATVNFGQRPFAYPLAGYESICSSKLAEYTYDVESPDWTLIKCRNAAQNFMSFDSIRGAGKYLSSNLTAAEATDVNSLISFNKNGFYLGNNANVNTLNNTYVAWMWKASQQQVTNNDGTIPSQVRANPALGFSIVNFIGTGANDTVGHGLGAKPGMIFVKSKTGTYNWTVYHKALTALNGIQLNLTNAAVASALYWNNTEPSSSVFTISSGNGNNYLNEDSIAYCFAEIEGFSKFGSYTGNGSADGPFIYTGGLPRFVMIKRADAVSDWYIWDTERDSINPLDPYLLANTPAVETGSVCIDALSNGFKLRSAIANVLGGTYIFAAFAENPFKYSNAN